MKLSDLLPTFTFFLLLCAFLLIPGHGAPVPAVSELPGEEVILLPDGRYTTVTELVNRADSLARQERMRNSERKSPAKKSGRYKVAQSGPALGANDMFSSQPGE